MRIRHHRASVAATAALVVTGLVAGSCDAGPGGGGAPPAPPVEGADRGPDAAVAPTPSTPSETVELTPIDHSGVTGAVAVARDDGGIALELDVRGLQPGAPYSAGLLEGRCVAGGPIRLPIELDRSGAPDAGRGELRADSARLPAGIQLFVQVDLDGQAVACADL